jgi:HlyD family secretion protein
MDRNLSKAYLRKRRTRRWIYGLSGLMLCLGLLLIIPSFMEPTVSLGEYRQGEVTRGNILTSISTDGKVEPVYQEVITSPVNAKVLAINHQPGDTISPDKSIIRLNMEELRRKYRKIKNEVALKKNEVARKREELRKRKQTLEADLLADSLRTARLKAYYEKEKELLDIGGTSGQTVEEARIDYQLSKLEQKKLREEYESFKHMIRLDLSSLKIEMSMQRQKLAEMEKLLEQAKITASRCGVVTRMSVTPGESVSSGQEVARVSNLDDYMVIGKISDRYVDRVHSGQSVQVLLDDTTLEGSVSSLTPGVEHGDVEYSVKLKNSAYSGLQAKKQTEVRLIQEDIRDTLRLPNANYYQGEGTEELFVVKGGELLKKEVRLGSCSYDHVLVKDGLKEGDRVIISRALYRNYPDHKRLKWKK